MLRWHEVAVWREKLSPSPPSLNLRSSAPTAPQPMAVHTCSTSISSGTALAQPRHGIRLIRLRICAKGRCDMPSRIANLVRTHLSQLSALALIAISLIAPIRAQSQSPANNLPAGNGKDIVAVACTQCHGLKLIFAPPHGPLGWKHFFDEMILLGGQLPPPQAPT